jgi:hypothetical protein
MPILFSISIFRDHLESLFSFPQSDFDRHTFIKICRSTFFIIFATIFHFQILFQFSHPNLEFQLQILVAFL